MNKTHFFIGIGPGKTGSSWLHNVLSQHPETQMPFVKEIRYFHYKEYIKRTNVLFSLFSKSWIFKTRRQKCYPFFKSTIHKILRLQIHQINRKELLWFLHFFCMPNTDKWYKKLFSNDKVSGDISPQYAHLSIAQIEHIKKINKETKIIIGLRDPIDRTWSHTKMKFRTKIKKSIKEVKQVEILDFFTKKNVFQSNDYTKIINQYKAYFPDKNIFIYYFEELQENPQKLFNKICNFLEISQIEIKKVNTNPNKGIIEKIPKEYEKELIKLNYKYIKEFAKNYPNKYSLAWLKNYKNKL